MGDCRTYSIYDQITLGLDELGVLDAKVMRAVLDAFRDSRADMDEGGASFEPSKRSGLTAEELSISLCDPAAWESLKAMPRDTVERRDAYCTARSEALGDVIYSRRPGR